MTDDNSELVDIDNLDTFEEKFFAEDAPEEVEVVEDTEADALATSEDKDAPAETGDEDQDAEEEAEPDPDQEEEKPKAKGKKSFQERIDELTRQRYEAERRAQEREALLLRRLEALESQTKEPTQPVQAQLPQGAPDPDAVNANGDRIYPLGEFDKAYVADLAKFTVNQEIAAENYRRQQQELLGRLNEAQEVLKQSWAQKVEDAAKENPDIRDNIASLANSFTGIDPAYGEYLAVTIMSAENGPEIMDYLSQNIGEAQKIVASGASAATYAIGRLDAQLSRGRSNQEEKRNRTVSHAPVPPGQTTKGRKGHVVVRGDTDNLDAFEKVFYKKR